LCLHCGLACINRQSQELSSKSKDVPAASSPSITMPEVDTSVIKRMQSVVLLTTFGRPRQGAERIHELGNIDTHDSVSQSSSVSVVRCSAITHIDLEIENEKDGDERVRRAEREVDVE
jgi:hypothetical protein